MGLPHKRERNSWQYFAGLHWDIVLCVGTHIFFNQHLTLPFSPCQTDATNCDYTVGEDGAQ
jgi:hypothetical protein